MGAPSIPLHEPDLRGLEGQRIAEALSSGRHAALGSFGRAAQESLKALTGARYAMLSHSCTASLEVAALLSGVGPGDEVIMPSFTFVSTATAFVLRGATPVFVDIDPETLNLSPSAVSNALTKRSRCIVPVHYAAVACDMDALSTIATDAGCFLVEDAAQGIHAYHRDVHLGTIGHCGTLSFHETKNISCGQGGALLVQDEELAARAEIILDKGTNREAFVRGSIDKYTWHDIGFSGRPSELNAAMLTAQLERTKEITAARVARWNTYQGAFQSLASAGRLRCPTIPDYARHNAHIYYLLLRNREDRDAARAYLNGVGIQAAFHYIPLHSSPAGRKFGRVGGTLDHTDNVASTILRLPLYSTMTDEQQQRVIDGVLEYCKRSQ